MDTIQTVATLLIWLTCLVFNTISIVVLVSAKTTKRLQFNRMLLYLSISNITFIIEVIFYRTILHFNDNGDGVAYSCNIIRHMISGSFICSLYLCFIISIKRLNATFVPKRRYLRAMSSPTAVLVGVVVIELEMLCLLVYNITADLKPWTALALLTPSTVFAVNTPIVLLCMSIVGIYVVVILRIVRQHSAMHIAGRETAGSIAAMKMRTRTLGIIIVLSLIGNMPRSLLSFFSLCVGPTTFVLKSFTFCNYLLVLNPLLDPLTYVFCIKEFRDRLKLFCSACGCCFSICSSLISTENYT